MDVVHKHFLFETLFYFSLKFLHFFVFVLIEDCFEELSVREKIFGLASINKLDLVWGHLVFQTLLMCFKGFPIFDPTVLQLL